MFLQMATFIPFRAKSLQSFPPVHFNTFWGWGGGVCLPSYRAQWSLYLAAPGKAEASLLDSTLEQQLVFTATFPISAKGRSYSSRFITFRGRVKDKASYHKQN